MSDNHRRYSSIRKSLSQMFSSEPQGYTAKQLNILAGSDQRHCWQPQDELSANCE